jgi:dGTPase
MTNKARRIIAELFAAFMSDPRLLPPQYRQRAELESGRDPLVRDPKARAVADYIAGMTDRYAMKEYRRLFAVGEI